MESEEWRDIPDWPYEVSNMGNVRRKETGKVLKPADINDYKCVLLYKKATRKLLKVHRLVAQAFIENVDGLPDVDHIDRNPSNNNLVNLRWASRSTNMINTKDRTRPNSFPRLIYPSGKSYFVQIKRNKEYVFYKLFKTLEEAVAARDEYLAANPDF